jgi:hypothetical protein
MDHLGWKPFFLVRTGIYLYVRCWSLPQTPICTKSRRLYVQQAPPYPFPSMKKRTLIKNNTPWDRTNEWITIPGRKYILTCLVQGKKNDSPIELGDWPRIKNQGQRVVRLFLNSLIYVSSLVIVSRLRNIRTEHPLITLIFKELRISFFFCDSKFLNCLAGIFSFLYFFALYFFLI